MVPSRYDNPLGCSRLQRPPRWCECDLNPATTQFSGKRDCGPAFYGTGDILARLEPDWTVVIIVWGCFPWVIILWILSEDYCLRETVIADSLKRVRVPRKRLLFGGVGAFLLKSSERDCPAELHIKRRKDRPCAAGVWKWKSNSFSFPSFISFPLNSDRLLKILNQVTENQIESKSNLLVVEVKWNKHEWFNHD